MFINSRWNKCNNVESKSGSKGWKLETWRQKERRTPWNYFLPLLINSPLIYKSAKVASACVCRGDAEAFQPVAIAKFRIVLTRQKPRDKRHDRWRRKRSRGFDERKISAGDLCGGAPLIRKRAATWVIHASQPRYIHPKRGLIIAVFAHRHGLCARTDAKHRRDHNKFSNQPMVTYRPFSFSKRRWRFSREKP